MKKLIFLSVLSLSLYSFNSWASLEIGEKLDELVLKGDSGGVVSGNSWSSNSMRGQVAVMYYVDPDEKDKNEELSVALKEKKFPRKHVTFYALINMDATWLPNFAISSSLEEKQREYPDTIYVKDMDKAGVKKWGIADDENNVVAFDPEGRVIFSKFGKLNQSEIEKLISLIQDEINKLKKSE